jgi:hypothetical protein
MPSPSTSVVVVAIGAHPKSDASNDTIPVNRAVIERIHRLKLLTVEVKAGTATRRYKIVKSCEPTWYSSPSRPARRCATTTS